MTVLFVEISQRIFPIKQLEGNERRVGTLYTALVYLGTLF